ncbi:Protein of unknown function [Neorhodopirellula lusitana]|uniref:Tll0287-like domain-containing protein n=1 Tax=Neorhodopirellula lusitana TaxID=445327 RepID=A0ABY1Q4N2_9BACT|nr:DUF3365 domain-containing protein [Neorhodopirellula lusitana]SMP59596.1 Protein of unknown function [Neorhodopirellula lusitana]
MRVLFRKPSLNAVVVGCVLLLITGCQKATVPVADADASPAGLAADTESVSIVPGQSPTTEQKDAMLAAKDALFQRLSGRLMEAMGQQGPAQAIAVCQQEANEIAADVGKDAGLKIGRAGVRLRNPKNQPPEWAKSLTEERVDTPTFVMLNNGNAAALLPIKLQGQCLMCHGSSDQIAPIIQDQLARLYPDDQATGFREGELRGWFHIEMPSS